MAYSKIVKIATGESNIFTVNFALGFINQFDIKAHVVGENDGLGAPIYRDITFITNTMLAISGDIVPSNTQVEFTRTVSKTVLQVNYSEGAGITEKNLDKMQLQSIMIAHEIFDSMLQEAVDRDEAIRLVEEKLADIRTEDGRLQPGIVTAESLSPDLYINQIQVNDAINSKINKDFSNIEVGWIRALIDAPKTTDLLDYAKRDEFYRHEMAMGNPHGVTKDQVGLDQVDNTSDLDKPISTATQAALDTKASVEDVAGFATQAELDLHTGNTSNPHAVSKAQVGLGNVDNTTDLLKPISTATQNALNLKADASALAAKADVSALALKADITYVDSEIAGIDVSIPAPQLTRFIANGTFTKPAGAKFITVMAMGGGGGGGGGRRGANTVNRQGGFGGHAGEFRIRRFAASDVDASVAVTIGNGGTGGAAGALADTDGSPGLPGGTTSFGTLLRAYGGAGGLGGILGSATVINGIDGDAGGGGQGGWRDAVNAGSTGGNGGQGSYYSNPVPGGTGVAASPGNPGTNAPILPGFLNGGSGGAGGTGNGYGGGTGGAPGGGGGGGGATNATGTNSQPGGNGARGEVLVIVEF
jgi:hypothetical protein